MCRHEWRNRFSRPRRWRFPEEHEHRIALRALFDKAFAPPKMVKSRTLQKSVELIVLQALEKRLSAQYLARLLVVFRPLVPGPALQF